MSTVLLFMTAAVTILFRGYLYVGEVKVDQSRVDHEVRNASNSREQYVIRKPKTSHSITPQCATWMYKQSTSWQYTTPHFTAFTPLLDPPFL